MVRLDRRSFVKNVMLGAVVLASSPTRLWAKATGATAMLPAGKVVDDFTVHTQLPLGLETKRSSFGIGPLTPRAGFFVRNNLPMPDPVIVADPDRWELEVTGTAREGTISLAELRGLGVQTVASVLQCSGNGRAFFPHAPSGSQWQVGAAGCALWSGVPVAAVLEHFGGVAGAGEFLTARGGEPLPQGVEANQVVVERSIPLEKGLEDCLLAWEMNGAPLSLVHGGPLRLIVPGYFGVNNVKWVKRLAATPNESGAHIQQAGYRVRPIGEEPGSQHPSMWRMPVKSWLNGPGADGIRVLQGRVILHGYAFSGERGIRTVEVSLGGKRWETAQWVAPDLGPNAWRSFVHAVDLEPGAHTFVSRATDTEGAQQPRDRVENHRGYGHNGWLDAALTVNIVSELPPTEAKPTAAAPKPRVAATAVAAVPIALSTQAQEGKELFTTGAQPPCGVCHQLADAGSAGAVGPNLDQLTPTAAQVRDAVSHGVGAMPAFSNGLTPQEIDALATYVSEATK